MSARYLCVPLVAALLAAVSTLSAEDEKEEKKAEFKATCPVSGQPAGEDHALTHRGKQVYFCCDNCPKAFEADPAKFTAATNFQWLQTGQIVQVACPFSGEKINPDTKTELNGVAFCFCCENCHKKFNDTADAEQLNLVFADITKGFTLQTLCPVSNKPIDPEHSVEHEGKRVYFCCDKCPAAFKKDPAKFLAKLPQFAEEKE